MNHLKYLKIDSNGLVTLGNKHSSLSFRMISDVNSDILDCILVTGVVILENRSIIGVILDSATFIFLPKGMIVFGHDGCLCEVGREEITANERGIQSEETSFGTRAESEAYRGEV